MARRHFGGCSVSDKEAFALIGGCVYLDTEGSCMYNHACIVPTTITVLCWEKYETSDPSKFRGLHSHLCLWE